VQKVVTVRVCAQDKKRVEEHLSDYLNDGWRVAQFTLAATGSGPDYAYAWALVLLEKQG
jgi:hypothetical protein